MTVIVDASVVVAALVDSGPVGQWAEQQLGADSLAAPHLMPAEAANVLRRVEIAGDVSSEVANVAHRNLLDLRVALYPYEPFADRVWQLRNTITAYDAWYVALAEALEATLVTLDMRLSMSSGSTCRFETPPY